MGMFATLHVANGTYQHYQFNYRIPENGKLHVLHIASGKQETFPHELTDGQLEAIIKQLERYGARPKSDVVSIKTPHALVYSVDRRPIPSDVIDAAREQDEKARQETAAKKTEESGMAQFHEAERSGRGNIQRTSLEVEQLEDRNDVSRKKGGVDTEVVVSRNAEQGKANRKRRR